MVLEMADVVKLYNRIEELENRVKQLEEKLNEDKALKAAFKDSRPDFPTECTNGKYRALAEYIYESWEKRIVLSYEELEDVLGFKLPESAHKLPHSYWANTDYHPYAKSWLKLGYKAKVDVENKKVTFERNIY